MALEITDQSIGDLLQQDKLVVIDFWAAWCGPCKMIAPIIDELAADNSDIIVGKVDVSENAKAASDYAITGIPCIVFIKNGQEVDRIKGVIPKKALQVKVDEYK